MQESCNHCGVCYGSLQVWLSRCWRQQTPLSATQSKQAHGVPCDPATVCMQALKICVQATPLFSTGLEETCWKTSQRRRHKEALSSAQSKWRSQGPLY